MSALPHEADPARRPRPAGPGLSRRGALAAGIGVLAGSGLLVPTGAQAATTRVLMHGSIHDNEDDGIAVVRKLWNATPPPDTCFLIVPTTNPDGNRAHTRNDARGVNLGRNLPGGQRGGHRGDQSYAGCRNLSEPESQALSKLIEGTDPTAARWPPGCTSPGPAAP